MGFEKRVLEVVESVTDTPAAFFEGTLFLETVDSEISVRVFDALWEQITPRIAFGKVNEFETSYDFL